MGTVYIIVGVFVGFLGSAIWRFEWTGLLSNVEKEKVVDKKGLARWAGRCIVTLALLSVVVGVSMGKITSERGELLACMAFMIGSQGIMIVYLSGLHRYTK